MTLDDIKRLDNSNMYQAIKYFPEEIEDAIKIGKGAKVRINVKGIRNILLTGLGGSAIGGDLLRSYLSGQISVPFIVNRFYTLPRFVDKNTLVIVSSYSGNTEETISAYKDAIKKKARVLCITTGGVVEQMAQKYNHPVIKIPKGYSPRAALAYSFFPLLVVLGKLRICSAKSVEMKETVELLKSISEAFSNPESLDNAPFKLAERLKDKLPVIYSETEHFDAVNLRWRGQFAENAKQLAFGHVLPEMNHNELVGWRVLTNLMKQMDVLFIRDSKTHPRVKIREEITNQVIAQYAAQTKEIFSEGKSLLSRMFYMIHFGDWISLYLAILNNVDPSPVEVIDYLKNELSKVN
jgi:glucose/mannose-6-phosphate isomerase